MKNKAIPKSGAGAEPRYYADDGENKVVDAIVWSTYGRGQSAGLVISSL